MIERLSEHTLGEIQRLQELEVLCGKQQTTIKRLTARIASLEDRLGKNSQNSSLPSSLDGPAIPPPQPVQEAVQESVDSFQATSTAMES